MPDTSQTPKVGPNLIGKIEPLYLAIPFIVGRHNKIADIEVKAHLNDQKSGIVFITGSSGVGKSHLVHWAANEALEKHKKVFINSVDGFVDNIKDLFKRHVDISTAYSARDFLILDDFQKFDNLSDKPEKSKNFYSVFLEIINRLTIAKKHIFLTSSKAIVEYTNVPDDIKTRIIAGYIVPIDLPDDAVKLEFFTYYAEKQEVDLAKIPSEYVFKIVRRCRQMRDVMGAVHRIKGKLEHSDLLIEHIIDEMNDFLPAVTTKNELFEKVFALISGHYGVDERDWASQGERTSRKVMKLKSVMYYLFADKLPVTELRKRLAIPANYHSYMLNKGTKNYEEITKSSLRASLDNLMRSSEN